MCFNLGSKLLELTEYFLLLELLISCQSSTYVFAAFEAPLHSELEVDTNGYFGLVTDATPALPRNDSDYLVNLTDFQSFMYDYQEMVTLIENTTLSSGEKEDDFRFFSNLTGWHFASPGEVPYYAILYARNLESNGLQTCGGAMLTRSKVMTICSCVISWLFNVWQPDPNQEFVKVPWTNAEDNKYDIISDIIYVQAGIINFDDKKTDHKLGYEVMEASECVETSAEIEKKTRSPHALTLQYAVFEVEPPFSQLPVDHIIPWPPIHLRYNANKLKNYFTGLKHDFPLSLTTVSTISFGVKLLKGRQLKSDSGKVFKPEKWAVMMNHILCNLTECGSIADVDNEKILCFHDNPKVKLSAELCGTMPGSPIISKGQFAGLTSIPSRPCRGGGFYGASVPKAFRDLITESLPAVTREPYVPELVRPPLQWRDYEFLIPYQYKDTYAIPKYQAGRSSACRKAVSFLLNLAIFLAPNTLLHIFTE